MNAVASVVSVSVLCDQDDQVVPAHQVDDIDEVHELEPVHQVDHKDELHFSFHTFYKIETNINLYRKQYTKISIHLYDLLDVLDLVHELHLCHPPSLQEFLVGVLP